MSSHWWEMEAEENGFCGVASRFHFFPDEGGGGREWKWVLVSTFILNSSFPLFRCILDRPAKINAARWQQLFWESQTNYLFKADWRKPFQLPPHVWLFSIAFSQMSPRLSSRKKKAAINLFRRGGEGRLVLWQSRQGWCWRTSQQPC